MIKKRLVIQTVSGQPDIDRSLNYLSKHAFWLGEIIVKEEGGSAYTYELQPDQKLDLCEMMDVLQHQIEELVDDDVTDAGYRIYLLKGKKANKTNRAGESTPA